MIPVGHTTLFTMPHRSRPLSAPHPLRTRWYGVSRTPTRRQLPRNNSIDRPPTDYASFDARSLGGGWVLLSDVSALATPPPPPWKPDVVLAVAAASCFITGVSHLLPELACRPGVRVRLASAFAVALAVMLWVAAGAAPAWTREYARPMVVTQVHNVTSTGAVEHYIWVGSSAPGMIDTFLGLRARERANPHWISRRSITCHQLPTAFWFTRQSVFMTEVPCMTTTSLCLSLPLPRSFSV